MSDPNSPTPSAEALLQHASWVRSLARTLASGPDADDLAQEAMLAALGGAPPAPGALRSWLGGVVRNRARKLRRSARHRVDRERRAARDEALPSPEELVGRVSIHRLLVEELESLREPYRATLILRYFEGLSPAQIARREGTPIATVTSRLTRAVALLRERLDRRHDGDRSAWLSAILPLWSRPESLAGSSVLAAMTLSKLLLATVAVAATVLLTTYLRGDGPTPIPESATAHTDPVEPDVERTRVVVPVELKGPGRVAATSESPLHTPDSDVTAPLLRTLPGRVFDVHGRPLGGVTITTAPTASPECSSAADGSFELSLPEDFAGLLVHGSRPGYSEVLSGLLHADSEAVTLVFAPTITLGGRVVDETGQGMAGAEVRFYAGDSWRAHFDVVPQSTSGHSWEAVSGEDGRFLLDAVPGVEGASLHAEIDGLRSAFLSSPPQTDYELLLEVDTTPLREVVRGRVVDAAGQPVSGAWVAAGSVGVQSDETGAFAMPLVGILPGYPLCAIQTGFLPAWFEQPTNAAGEAVAWPDMVELRLGGPALAIAGEVQDAQGGPLPGLEVWLADPTPYGAPDGWLSHLEVAAAGGRGSEGVMTDERGRFRIEGLLERDYDLVTVVPESLEVLRLEGVQAGSAGVVLRLGESGVADLAGLVVDVDGLPISGVKLEAGVFVREWTWPGPGFSPSRQLVYGRSSTTDAEGRFRFADLPPEIDCLRLKGEGVVPSTVPVAADTGRMELVVVGQRRRFLQVEVGGALAAAEGFQVLDPSGARLRVYTFSGKSYSAAWRSELQDGRSPILAVSDRAATLVLLGPEGTELARQALAWGADEVLRLRLD